jgi:hypothetical protein
MERSIPTTVILPELEVGAIASLEDAFSILSFTWTCF